MALLYSTYNHIFQLEINYQPQWQEQTLDSPLEVVLWIFLWMDLSLVGLDVRTENLFHLLQK